ncbi:MAG: hypothetical protein ACK5LK_06585 [Chthoniobacterales bacterium]
MKRKIFVVIFLLLFGVLKLPFELRLDNEQREAFFRGTKFDLSLREQVGQMGFLAALSGFRSLIAAILWIQAHTAWENTEWGRMAGLFQTVTALQPRSLLYWDMAAWHMAWNASIAALDDPNEPSEALRIRNQHQYFDLGRSFLEAGIRNNADRYLLYDRLGILLRDKYEDHCGSADAFAKAASFPDAPSYTARFAGYEMAKCKGREREAYDYLMKLYNKGEKQHLPSLLTSIQNLEKTLDIPKNERIPEPPPEKINPTPPPDEAAPMPTSDESADRPEHVH